MEKFWEIAEIFGNFEKIWEILPQFTHFHVEKNLAQKYICGEKITYMRSERIDNEYIQFCNRKLKIEDEGHISTRSR